MKAYKILDEMTEKQNGYLRLCEAKDIGVSRYAVSEYVHQNDMERVAPGVYITEDAWEDRLFLLQIRNRQIIFSHETALYIHGLSDREPFSPVITVARGYNAKHIKDDGVIVHTASKDLFELGLKEAKTFVGNTIRVYDKERCICDIVKRKKQMDIQIFQTAIRSYFRDRDKDIHKLMEYAKKMKLEERVRQYTEVLL